jgi:hypothetical protein
MRRVASNPGGHEASESTWRNCVVDQARRGATDVAREEDARQEETARILFADVRSTTMLCAVEEFDRLARDPGEVASFRDICLMRQFGWMSRRYGPGPHGLTSHAP